MTVLSVVFGPGVDWSCMTGQTHRGIIDSNGESLWTFHTRTE